MAITREEIEAMLVEQKKALEASIREEVSRQVKESHQIICGLKVEAERLYARMQATLYTYAEEAPVAERLCQRLQEGLNDHSRKRSGFGPKVFGLGRRRSNQEASKQTLYRNIKCTDNVYDRSQQLHVFPRPEPSLPSVATVPLGELLPVRDAQRRGKVLWLHLDKGARTKGKNLEGCWVQAELEDGTVQCVRLSDHNSSNRGRPEAEEHFGQGFQQMSTAGFSGTRHIVVLSASRQAFWRGLNLTCLLRNIASCSISTQQLGEPHNVDEWLPLYAVNIFRYGLGEGCRKKMLVTVKPTANWRRYAGPLGVSARDLDDVRPDLGNAESSECCWAFNMGAKLGIDWSEIIFCTALSLLRQHGRWTCMDCIEETIQQLESARQGFEVLDIEGMADELFTQLFCVEEAFGLANLQTDIGLSPSDQQQATHLPNPVQWQDKPTVQFAVQLGYAKRLLSEMAVLWSDARNPAQRTLKKLGLVEEDLDDVGLLSSKRNVLHAAARDGAVQIVVPVLDRLREAEALQDCLIRKDEHLQTPLHAALAAGHAQVTQLLLDELETTQQLDQILPLRDQRGCTALHWAAEQGLESALQCLLATAHSSDQVRQLLQEEDSDARTPLHCAAGDEANLLKFMDAVVAAGATSEWLEEATQSKSQLQYLLYMRDSCGRSPLHLAAYAGLQNAARCLLDAAASCGRACEVLLEEDDEGRTPLLYASSQEKVMNSFMTAVLAADVARDWLTCPDQHGRTPLHSVATTGPAQAARALLDAAHATGQQGQLLLMRDGAGRTPVHWAAAAGLGDATRPLLEAALACNLAQEALDAQDNQGRTALDCARESRALRTFVDAALAAGLRGELARDSNRVRAAISVAAAHGDVAGVRALLAAAVGAGGVKEVLLAGGGDFYCGGSREVRNCLEQAAYGVGLKANRPNWNLLEIRT